MYIDTSYDFILAMKPTNIFSVSESVEFKSLSKLTFYHKIYKLMIKL